MFSILYDFWIYQTWSTEDTTEIELSTCLFQSMSIWNIYLFGSSKFGDDTNIDSRVCHQIHKI